MMSEKIDIEIKNRYTGEIIIAGKYLSIKDALEINREADLSGTDLREADLSGTDLSGANLREADLRRANLREAYLREADLREADLSGTDLRRANLREAYLREADLREANLSGADLSGADLRRTDLSGTYLRRTDLSGTNLDYSVLYFGCGSFSPKTDRRQRIQLAFHWAQWVIQSEDIGDDEKEFVNNMIDYLNEFHRGEISRLEKIK